MSKRVSLPGSGRLAELESYAPSSQERLPVPGPLGTVRDGFPSHGSSLTKACVTRGLDSLM